MITPVSYSGELKDKVDEYNQLDPSEKIGAYWDRTNDTRLADLKKHIKDHYILAQDYKCPYCQQRLEVNHNGAWDAEHIIPKSSHAKFMFTEKNLCVACKDCNQAKGDTNTLKNPHRINFPENSSDYLIIHPHFDSYEENIKIIKEASFYLPKNEKGRRTIETCGLLRFLYKYANYGRVPDEIKIKIGRLHSELMNATTSIEEHFILSCIQNLTTEGIRARETILMEQQFT